MDNGFIKPGQSGNHVHGEDCDHDHEEHEGLLIETTDEDGQVHVFEKISEIEVEGQDYALLIYRGKPDAPVDLDEEEEEVVVMRIGYEDGHEVFEAIEDDAEFERVVEAVNLMEDDEDGLEINLEEFISTKESHEEK